MARGAARKAAAGSGRTLHMLVREANGANGAQASGLLPLPNVLAAAALDRVGRLLFSQLLFADWTGFGHYICHSRDLSDHQRSLP